MRYYTQVRARITVWLSALLLFNAVFTVPVARVVSNRVSCRVVYSEQKKQKKKQAEQVCEPPEAAHPAIPVSLGGSPAGRAAGPILDSSLFQRPPPALS